MAKRKLTEVPPQVDVDSEFEVLPQEPITPEVVVGEGDGTQVFGGIQYWPVGHEQARTYRLVRQGAVVDTTIEGPEWVTVRQDGAHQIIDSVGVIHVISADFIHYAVKLKD